METAPHKSIRMRHKELLMWMWRSEPVSDAEAEDELRGSSTADGRCEWRRCHGTASASTEDAVGWGVPAAAAVRQLQPVRSTCSQLIMHSHCCHTVLAHAHQRPSTSVCLFLSACLCLCVSVHVSLFFPVYVCLPGCLSLSICGCLSVFPCLDMPVRLSDYLCLYLFICLFVSVYICLLVSVYMCMSICFLSLW